MRTFERARARPAARGDFRFVFRRDSMYAYRLMHTRYARIGDALYERRRKRVYRFADFRSLFIAGIVSRYLLRRRAGLLQLMSYILSSYIVGEGERYGN